MVAVQEASITAHEDVRDMLRIFTRNILEPVSISAWREVPRSSADLGPPHHLSSHTELRHAVNFLISAAYLLSPAEIDFDIRRLLLNQVLLACLSTPAEESASACTSSQAPVTLPACYVPDARAAVVLPA